MTNLFFGPKCTTRTCVRHGDLAGSIISAASSRWISDSMNSASSVVYHLEREGIGVHSGRRNSNRRGETRLAAATDSSWVFKGGIVRASSGLFITKVTDECSLRNSWPTITSEQRFLITLKVVVGYVPLWKESLAATMPQVGIDTYEEAMPIELGDPLTGRCSFLGIFKSTKFLEAPESTKTWTGKSSNRPSTTAGLRLEGALAR